MIIIAGGCRVRKNAIYASYIEYDMNENTYAYAFRNSRILFIAEKRFKSIIKHNLYQI